MSIDGRVRLALQRAAQQRLAEQRARRKAEAQITELTARLADRFAPAEERFLRAARAERLTRLTRIVAQVDAAPTEALAALGSLQADWAQAVARAQAEARAWSERRAQCEAQVAAARSTVTSAAAHLGDAWAGIEGQIEATLTEAALAAVDGQVDAVRSALASVSDALSAAELAAQAEAERRAAVSALIKTLRGMGFAVASPRRARDGADRVVLEGRMPSGRKARFEVELGGAVAFDLDGYPGAACKDEFDGIEQALLERFQVRMGPPQFVWKNPDRILKGAREMPGQGSPPARSRGGRR